MKLLKNEETSNYHEIEVEYSLLWFRWRAKYRKVGGTLGCVYRFEEPNEYYKTSISEEMNVRPLFHQKLN